MTRICYKQIRYKQIKKKIVYDSEITPRGHHGTATHGPHIKGRTGPHRTGRTGRTTRAVRTGNTGPHRTGLWWPSDLPVPATRSTARQNKYNEYNNITQIYEYNIITQILL
jgi:hypothetical protein